jgi:hypothetical protein
MRIVGKGHKYMYGSRTVLGQGRFIVGNAWSRKKKKCPKSSTDGEPAPEGISGPRS